MSIFRIIFCDGCNTEQNFPNFRKIKPEVLAAYYDPILKNAGAQGYQADPMQNRGVAVLDDDSYLAEGWNETDEDGHQCPFCIVEYLLEAQRAGEGDDETFIGEMPQVIEQVLENRKDLEVDEE